MKRIMTTSQMREADLATIEKIGLPSPVLMERAALAVKDTLIEENFPLEHVLILCGGGNNGGDGIAVGRMLHLAGYQVDICVLGDPQRRSTENRRQMEIAKKYGTNFVNNPELSEYTTIVDSVFGIGLSRNLKEEYRLLFEKVNRSDAAVMAVDIPSGIDGNTGNVLGNAIQADMTVTFAFAKPGLLLYPGASYAGRVKVCDIGIYEQEDVSCVPSICQLEETDMSMIPRRRASGNKGTFGKVLLIAGSYCMSGASWLAALACFRMGAGMVKIITREENREILQQQLPEAMLTCYGPSGCDHRQIDEAMEWADVVGMGPGIGQSKQALDIVAYVMTQGTKPLLIDADGLNILSQHMEWLANYSGPCVVTPHMGEMSRLTGKTVKEIAAERLVTAGDFSEKYHVVCVLKDARTVISWKQDHFVINTTGNSGMATAGSGDVLSGMILGLMAQGMQCEEAAMAGVWIHGKAGDLAKETWGEFSMKAGDIITCIAAVMKKIDQKITEEGII